MESKLINYLRSQPGTELIGDDAAVIDGKIITVDMLTEGVDFILADADPTLIGRKALAVNLSDIAAMGGIPRWIFMAVALPKEVIPANNTESSGGALHLAQQLFTGMQPLIDKHHLVLAGGDTNTWDGGLVLSITLIGNASEHGVIRRNGGKPGDRLLVTGKLGGSILRHQFLFEPRIKESLYLNEHYSIHSAIDISDGLSLDLSRLATESRVGATLYEASIPIAEDAFKLAEQSGRLPIEHALSDGEDFELLFSVSADTSARLLASQPLQTFGVTLYAVGELTEEPGLRMLSPDGNLCPMTPKGFEH